MKVQELSAGDIFYICYALTWTVRDGPYRLDDSAQLTSSLVLNYKATRVVDSRTGYLLGQIECIKVGSIPNEAW